MPNCCRQGDVIQQIMLMPTPPGGWFLILRNRVRDHQTYQSGRVALDRGLSKHRKALATIQSQHSGHRRL
jgi:hypothetical protein